MVWPTGAASSNRGSARFSFAEHLRHHIDTGGPNETPSAEQVSQGILGGGENERYLNQILHRDHLIIE